jgi:hypothetical protein
MLETVGLTNSPFIQGHAFGEGEKESFFLMAVAKRKIIISKEFFISVVEPYSEIQNGGEISLLIHFREYLACL